MTTAQRYSYWRSLGHCALQAYIHATERAPQIPLVHFPDPRRPGFRRHWQRANDWASAVACYGRSSAP